MQTRSNLMNRQSWPLQSVLCLVVISLVFLAPLASGQRQYEDAKLIASDGETQDGYGWSMDALPEIAVIGAPLADYPSANHGAAYVYKRNLVTKEWEEETILVDHSGGNYSHFGVSVAVSDVPGYDTVLVGSSVGRGRVTVFSNYWGNWSVEAVLEPAGNQDNDHFGHSISFNGYTAVIGAPYADGNGPESGVAYVFRRNSYASWREEAKLCASDGTGYETFGHDVDYDEIHQVAVIGAYNDDANGTDSGAAYVFRDKGGFTWDEEAKLIAWNGGAQDFFGFSVAIGNREILVGAPRAQDMQLDRSGVVYSFKYSDTLEAWIGRRSLLHVGSDAGDYLGCSLSLNEDVALVGARYADGTIASTGTAYVFHYYETIDGWVLSSELEPSDGEASDHFGWSVAHVPYDGNFFLPEVAMVGARYGNAGSTSGTGAAYVFELDPPVEPETWYVPDDFATIGQALSATGLADEIIVRPGTYVENISFPSDRSIALKSERGADETVIDGSRNGPAVYFYGYERSLLDGFTITNGSGQSTFAHGVCGGGVFCEFDFPVIKNCVIRDNEVEQSSSDGAHGGGLFLWQSRCHLLNTVLAENNADWYGDALYSYESALLVVNNTIWGNGNWIVSGIGVDLRYSRAKIANSILWNNFDWQASIGYGSVVDFSHSDVEGGQSGVQVESGGVLNWGTGMIDAAPVLSSPGIGDLHLNWDSPCKHTGDSSVAGLQEEDFEGDPRVAGAAVDMGADEFHVHLYRVGNVIPGGPIDVCIVGEPALPVVLAQGGNLLGTPIETAHGFLHIWPIKNSWNLGVVPSSGIRILNATVPAGWIPGNEYYFQAHVGAWGDPSTLLTNLMILIAE